MELYLLLQDFNLHIIPHRDKGDAYALSAKGVPNSQIKEALSLWNRGRGADSFVGSVASTLLTEHEAWLEMAFKPDGPNGLPFKPLIVHSVRRTATGNLIQEVPALDEPKHQLQWEPTPPPQIIELDDERMIHVCLPEKYPSQLLKRAIEGLAETDLQNPLMAPWILESMATQMRDTPALDIREAIRTRTLRIAQAALPIGWTAREINSGRDRYLGDYYYYWRELRFLHFRSSMRKQAEEALYKVLSMAGAECGFETTVTASGLFTPPEVEEIIRDYEAGKITFSAVNDIIFEKPDSVYSRDRHLF